MDDSNTRIQDPLLPAGAAGSSGVGNSRQGYVPVNSARFNPNSSSVTYVSSSTTTTANGGQDDSWGRAKKYCWWTAVVLTVVLVFLLVALKLFLFKPISKGPPKLDNSTAIERNTKTRFNLLIHGPTNRVQSLTGATVWVYTIPMPLHPKIYFAAVGLYVDRVDGKRTLRKFKDMEMDDETFEDVKDVLLQTKMTETMRVVLTTTPPSGRMLQMWETRTSPLLQKTCPTIAEKEWNSFAEFFPDPFNKGDEFVFERRDGQDLYAWKKDQDRKDAKKIGGPCMAKSLFEFHLSEQKEGLVNLLEDFFER